MRCSVGYSRCKGYRKPSCASAKLWGLSQRWTHQPATGKLLPELTPLPELIPRVAVCSIWVGLDGGCLPLLAHCELAGGKQVEGTASLGCSSKAPTLPPRFDIVWDLYFVTKTCQLCSQTVQANLSSRKHDMDTTMLATLSLSYANMNPDDEMIIMREHEPRMMK